jgi:Protein of unknown function (DUF3159)
MKPEDPPDADGLRDHDGGGHAHRELSEALRGGADPGTGAPGDATTEQLMAQAIGGWRGLIDSSVPSTVFLVVYLVDGHQLSAAVWSAVAAGVVISAWRLLRRQSLQQVLSGFIGVAFCAWLASRTGRAEDFYLPGLLLNAAYAVGLSVSCLVGHPLLGYAVGAATGDLTGWRGVPEQRRAYTLATWFFTAVFALRIAVEVPLYLAEAVGPLGVAKLALGWPAFALAAWLSYRVIRKARAEAPLPDVAVDEV